MLQERIRHIAAHPVPTLSVAAPRGSHPSFEESFGFDGILAAIVLAAGARTGVVTSCGSGRRAEPRILATAGERLTDDVLQQVLDASNVTPPISPDMVGTWQVLRIDVRVRAGGEAMTLTLLSDALGWSFKLDRSGGLDGLRPLIDAAFSSWNRMNVAECGLQGLSGAIDCVDFGILLLDRSSSVSFANRAGRRMLEQAEFLRWSGDRIAGVEMRDSLALQVAVQHAIDANVSGAALQQAPVLALRSPGGGTRMIVAVVPATTPAVSADTVAAVVYLLDPSIDATKQLQPVCRLYRLSTVEGRLACLLAGGESLREAATAMRIKEPTARGYLKQIFSKTDTNRQADLVRVMLTSVLRMRQDIDQTFLA